MVVAAPAQAAHRISVELNLVQPFVPTVHIIRPKLAWTAWGAPGALRGDLVVGLYVRPHIAHDVVETIDEYMLTVGYRQYFWRGLHVETLLDGGIAWGRNLVDGQDYTTASLFLDINVGYRVAFFEPGGFLYEEDDDIGFFVTAQGGLLIGLGVADIGPRNGKPDNFPQAELLVGVSF